MSQGVCGWTLTSNLKADASQDVLAYPVPWVLWGLWLDLGRSLPLHRHRPRPLPLWMAQSKVDAAAGCRRGFTHTGHKVKMTSPDASKARKHPAFCNCLESVDIWGSQNRCKGLPPKPSRPPPRFERFCLTHDGFMQSDSTEHPGQGFTC